MFGMVDDKGLCMDQNLLIDVPRVVKREYCAREVKLMVLRETLSPAEQLVCDTPTAAVAYFRRYVEGSVTYRAEVENLVVLLLNCRRRIVSHAVVTTGTQDTLLVHPREVFRVAVVGGANGIVLMHNHPSGDATPSEADVKVTRDLFRAGQTLKIELIDHIVVGAGEHRSLRELGYIYN